ncbi:WD40-repeat-containing domain protein [Umbelopsis sp. AD052]|nr:WD40-repeat-containing domain protein [Umbelopsis sp. AD052]
MALLRVTSSPPATSPSTDKTPLSLKKVWRYFHRSLHSPSSKHSPHVFHTLPTSLSCPPLSTITPTETRGSPSLTYSKTSPESLALTVAAVDRSTRIDEGFFQAVKPSFHQSTVDFMAQLPQELACHILMHLDDVRSLVSASLVSKRWHHLCRDNLVWKRKYTLQKSWKKTPQSAGWVDYRDLYIRQMRIADRWRKGAVTTSYLTGHTDSIYCVQFDTEKIVTGSRDTTIKFWSMETRKCLRTLNGHDKSVLCLEYDKDIMISGSSDCTILVWSMETFKPRNRLRGHSAGVLDVCFDEKYIISCSKDTTIRIWDKETGISLRTLQGHRGPVNAVQLQDNRLVSGSGDALIKMWNTDTGECIRQFSGHVRGLACVQFDGKRIVSGSNDQCIKVWDADTGECTMTCEGHTDLVRALHFDDDKIVSGSYDQSVRVWDIRTGACLLNFQSGHSSWVFDVMLSATKIVSVSQDKTILIMDFAHDIDVRGIE